FSFNTSIIGLYSIIKVSCLIKADQGNLIAIAENYPTLISGEQFTQLQIALSDVENKLAQRREGFNDATTEYNTAIQMFPDSLIANAFRFSALPLLDISEDEKKYQGVQFK
ncbi:LemA family protein, partial [Providencia rettgeri]